MKNKILKLLLAIVICFTLVGCGQKEVTNEQNGESNTKKNKSVTSNSMVTVDGMYLNNEYTDEEGLKQVVLFYTISAGEENLDISSYTIKLKINKNEYEPVIGIPTPELTQYYYSNVISNVYVGKSLKVAVVFKVPDGDLVSGKDVTLDDFYDYSKGIKLKTDDIKKMDNLTAISLDVDKEYAEKRQAEEKEKLTDADAATTKKVKKDLNGYYFDMSEYLNGSYVKYRLEFFSPNKFTLTTSVSGSGITSNGTYRVAKGYIVLHYDTNDQYVNTPYRYENGDITIDNPFAITNSSKIF